MYCQYHATQCPILQLLSLSIAASGRGRVCEVTMQEEAPVLTAMCTVAKAAGIVLDTTSPLFGILEHLRIHKSKHTLTSLPTSTRSVSTIPHAFTELPLVHDTQTYSIPLHHIFSLSPFPLSLLPSDCPLDEHKLICDATSQWPRNPNSSRRSSPRTCSEESVLQ